MSNITDWHDYPSNYSQIGNVSLEVDGFGSWLQYTNIALNNTLGAGILMIIFIMSFGLSLVSGSKKAILTSSFITFVFSIYLFRLDMINPVIMILLLVGVIIGMIGVSKEKGL